MERQLLLACGNTLRGDDGAGWEIARTVKADPTLASVKVIAVQQFTPELSEAISRATTVVFVDCSVVSPPGVVSAFAVEPSRTPPGSLNHSSDPAALLALSRDLYGTVPEQAYAVTVGGWSFEFSEALSEPVRRAMPEAVATLKLLFYEDATRLMPV